MGHTGISVNIMLSLPDREDFCDREIPSHGRGGRRRNRCGGRGCDAALHLLPPRRLRFSRSFSARRCRWTRSCRAPCAHAGPTGPACSTPCRTRACRSPARATLSRAAIAARGPLRRPRTAEGRRQGQPAADVQHHQHPARRPGRRVGHHHRDGPAPGSDNREPHVRRPGRLEAVARLGDDADPVGAFGGRLTAAGWADTSPQS